MEMKTQEHAIPDMTALHEHLDQQFGNESQDTNM
jgi:hypothetical protein